MSREHPSVAECTGAARRHRRPPPTAEHHHCAGGVLLRDGEILLISAQPDRWQLPKGHLESGESAAQAAVREVEEETGVRGDVIAVLPTVEYRYRAGGRWIDKRVEYYLLRFVAGNEQGFDRSEVRAARWFTWAEALAEMSFENEREVVRQALEWTRGVREPPR